MRGPGIPGHNLLPLVLAGLLVGMTYWLDLASRPTSVDDGKLRHDPDYIIDNFEVRRFGPEGSLQHTLRARQLRHYPDDDSSVVEAPDLTYHQQPPTHVEARIGHMDGKGEHVELIDDVRIVRGATREKAETVLVTTRLDVWPDEEIASNREPVTITQGQSQVHGSRLHADNKIATYVLEGSVRGIFHRSTPNQPKTGRP